MKDLIVFKAVDGYQIVTGFKSRKINPRATKRITSEIIKQENSLPDYFTQAQKEVKLALTVKGPARKGVLEKAHFRMGNAVTRYKEDIETLQNDNVVYMSVMPDQILSEDTTDLQVAFAELGNRELLSVDGAVVKDFRGRIYWKKVDQTWESTAINAIGVNEPSGAELYTTLTDANRVEITEQAETARIDALSAEAKTNEKDRLLTTAGLMAVSKRSLAEIGGADAATALSEAQAWLATETAAIEAKYA